jgi:hypothetical protein
MIGGVPVDSSDEHAALLLVKLHIQFPHIRLGGSLGGSRLLDAGDVGAQTYVASSAEGNVVVSRGARRGARLCTRLHPPLDNGLERTTEG